MHGAILALRYVGNRAEKLFASAQLNYFNGAGSRLNTTRGIINVRGNFASSNYNGLEADFTKQIGRTLSIRANYVFSKDLDNGSEIFALGNSGDRYTANLALSGRGQDYGPSAFDHRHYASISYVYTPVGFHVSNKFADTIVGALTRNFTISGIEQFQSGAYGSFYSNGYDLNGDGDATNDRPILGNTAAPLGTAGVDGTFVGGTPGVYYDVAAFNLRQTLTPVNASQVHFLLPVINSTALLNREISRDSFENPGSTRNDIAIQKGFGTGLLHLERGQLLVRMEVQNVGNHNDRGDYLDTDVTNFGNPSSFNRPVACSATLLWTHGCILGQVRFLITALRFGQKGHPKGALSGARKSLPPVGKPLIIERYHHGRRPFFARPERSRSSFRAGRLRQ